MHAVWRHSKLFCTLPAAPSLHGPAADVSCKRCRCSPPDYPIFSKLPVQHAQLLVPRASPCQDPLPCCCWTLQQALVRPATRGTSWQCWYCWRSEARQQHGRLRVRCGLCAGQLRYCGRPQSGASTCSTSGARMRSSTRFLQTASQRVRSCAELAVGHISGVLGFHMSLEANAGAACPMGGN
jgi:hypothetical protein